MRKIHQRVERAQSCLPASSYTAKWVMIPVMLFWIGSWRSKTENSTDLSIFIHFEKVWETLWPRFICVSSCCTAQEHHLQWPRIVESPQIHRYVISLSISVVCSVVAFQNRTDEGKKTQKIWIHFVSIDSFRNIQHYIILS